MPSHQRGTDGALTGNEMMFCNMSPIINETYIHDLLKTITFSVKQQASHYFPRDTLSAETAPKTPHKLMSSAYY